MPQSDKEIRRPAPPPDPGRRTFLRESALAAAAACLAQSPLLGPWLEAAASGTPSLLDETVNGLLAFVVPGADPYSLAQGVSTPEPGGVDAGVTQILIETMDGSAPFFPSFSAVVAGILNDLALAVGSPPSGAFASPFARLSFGQKAAVFQIMDATEALKPLGGVLPAIVAFLSYSEGGALDREARTLTSRPVGWTISRYSGVAEGRPEFRGYLQEFRNDD